MSKEQTQSVVKFKVGDKVRIKQPGRAFSGLDFKVCMLSDDGYHCGLRSLVSDFPHTEICTYLELIEEEEEEIHFITVSEGDQICLHCLQKIEEPKKVTQEEVLQELEGAWFNVANSKDKDETYRHLQKVKDYITNN